MTKLEELSLVKDGKVTLEGWEVFSELLDQVKPYPVLTGIIPSPFGIFEKYLSKVVPSCVEMVLIQDLLGYNKVYLTYREDKYWKGCHIPGSYMRPKETLIETCQRIAGREVPGIKIVYSEIIGCVTHPDSPRFHDTSVITMAHYKGKPKGKMKGKWFKINRLPKDLIDVHKPFVPLIKNYLRELEKDLEQFLSDLKLTKL